MQLTEGMYLQSLKTKNYFVVLDVEQAGWCWIQNLVTGSVMTPLTQIVIDATREVNKPTEEELLVARLTIEHNPVKY